MSIAEGILLGPFTNVNDQRTQFRDGETRLDTLGSSLKAAGATCSGP